MQYQYRTMTIYSYPARRDTSVHATTNHNIDDEDAQVGTLREVIS